MPTRSQSLAKPEYKPLSTISFYCACGKRLYSISTNVISVGLKVECPKCNRLYECSDSVIAKESVAKCQ